MLLAQRWRLLDSGAADGATNMAVDAALLDESRRTGTATLRIYGWSRPTLSLGRHERTRDRLDRDRLSAAGIDVVRRPTGGRALLHDREVTYSITAPASDDRLAPRYAAINEVLIDALARLGVRAGAATPRTPAPRPGRSVCFAEPSAGELVIGDRKLVASAQLQEKGAFLQHGSILLHDDQPRIAEFVSEAGSSPTHATSLAAELGRDCSYSEVRDALVAALHASLATAGVTSPALMESIPLDAAGVQRHRAKLLDPAWTWRR